MMPVRSDKSERCPLCSIYFAGNKEHASCVAFSLCGGRLLTGGEAGVLRLWELDTAATETDDAAAKAGMEVKRQTNATDAIATQRNSHCKRRRVVEQDLA